jgi:protein-serine/threonine kinase
MASSEPQTPAEQYGDNVATSDLTKAEPQDSDMLINNQNVVQNASYSISAPTATASVAFRTNTIAPSPPPNTFAKPSDPVGLSALNTASNPRHLDPHKHSPLSDGLHLQTDVIPAYSLTPAQDRDISSSRKPVESESRPQNPIAPPPRTPSIKKALASAAGSQIGSAPNSALSSPMLSAMADVTPLPSPLMSGDSPGPWRKLISRPTSREYIMPGVADSALVTASGESISSAILNQSKRRAYHGLVTNASEPPNDALINRQKNGEGHNRNRSISEYVPETVQVPKTRHQTVSSSHAALADSTSDSIEPTESHMRRERNLAIERGIAPAHRQENILPTPPASRTGAESSDSDSSVSNMPMSLPRTRKPRYEYFDAHTVNDEKRRRWRALKTLGQGTFSKVLLATSQAPEEEERIDEDDVSGERMDGITHQIEPKIDRRKLVAIKICEHGPKGGASEERVEMSLKRELEIMKSIHHPSLVHLKAWSIEDTRAILVLSYCPGGDLFDVASEHKDLIVPPLLRRMFAELVGAVQYLHERHIVHRDIKLESESNKLLSV